MVRFLEGAPEGRDDQDGEEGDPVAELPQEIAGDLFLRSVGPRVVDRADVAAGGGRGSSRRGQRVGRVAK